jgi:hypothetical protein
MRIIVIVLLSLLFLFAGCGYPDAGALENNQWIGTIENPYQGMVSDNFYTWNGSAYVRIPATGLPGATGATGATGAQGPAGDSGFGQGARVYSTVNIPTTSGNDTKIRFNTESYDTDNCHNSTNSSRLTCNTSGKYLMVTNIQTATGISGTIRQIVIWLNGDTPIGVIYDANFPNTGIVAKELSTIYNLNIGDYVEVGYMQSTGSNMNILASSVYTPSFMFQRIGN